RTWWLMRSLRLKRCWQMGQLKGFSSEWDSRCRLRWYTSRNAFPHVSHAWFLRTGLEFGFTSCRREREREREDGGGGGGGGGGERTRGERPTMRRYMAGGVQSCIVMSDKRWR